MKKAKRESKVSVKKVKIFKIRNRRGYACVCLSHLTEGRNIYQAYARMLKALRRSGISLKSKLVNLARLVTSL